MDQQQQYEISSVLVKNLKMNTKKCLKSSVVILFFSNSENLPNIPNFVSIHCTQRHNELLIF